MIVSYFYETTRSNCILNTFLVFFLILSISCRSDLLRRLSPDRKRSPKTSLESLSGSKFQENSFRETNYKVLEIIFFKSFSKRIFEDFKNLTKQII